MTKTREQLPEMPEPFEPLFDDMQDEWMLVPLENASVNLDNIDELKRWLDLANGSERSNYPCCETCPSYQACGDSSDHPHELEFGCERGIDFGTCNPKNFCCSEHPRFAPPQPPEPKPVGNMRQSLEQFLESVATFRREPGPITIELCDELVDGIMGIVGAPEPKAAGIDRESLTEFIHDTLYECRNGHLMPTAGAARIVERLLGP